MGHWITVHGNHVYIGEWDSDKIDNPKTNPLHPQTMTKEQAARYGDCKREADKWAAKTGGDTYSCGSHVIGVSKQNKVYDYVLGYNEDISVEDYVKKVPYQFGRIDKGAELKAITNDIINKYLHYINADALKDFIFTRLELEYMKGLEAGEINFNQNFIPNYHTVSFIQKYAFDNVKGLTEEMKEKLRKELSQGLMNGESVSQLKLRILDVMDSTINRAEMITRTETNRAFNMGHYQAAKESGLNVVKEWSSQEERISRAGNLVPCPACESLNGQQVAMNEKFKTSTGEEYLLPPVHPHCACRVIYVQKK